MNRSREHPMTRDPIRDAPAAQNQRLGIGRLPCAAFAGGCEAQPLRSRAALQAYEDAIVAQWKLCVLAARIAYGNAVEAEPIRSGSRAYAIES